MLRKIFLSLVAGFCVFSAVLGCSNEISSQNDLVLMLAQGGSGKKSAVEYGSISIVPDGNRSLNAEDITSASVTVSGYGISDITGTVTMGDEAGKGTATVNNVPVGRRVVTITSNVTGAVMRAVVDVQAGTTTNVTVNWASTAVGNVYYYLIKTKKIEIANIDASAFSSAIDTTVHPALINAEAIAKAYPSVGAASSYVTGYGTVAVTSSNASGYTLQITDVASKKMIFSSSVTGGELKAYPGKWKAKVLNSSSTVVAEEDITVVEGEVTTVDVTYQAAGQNVSFDGKTIVFVKADYTPYLYAWIESPKTELTGGWSANSAMTAVTSDYMSNYNGWYMRDITSAYADSTEVINFILLSNASTKTSGDLTGSAGTFWYDATTSTLATENPSPVVSTEDKVVLTVNSAEEPGDAVKIYVSASSAPSLWVWQPSGLACTEKMGYTWSSQPTCVDATDLIYGEGWYVLSIPGDCYTEGKAFSININSSGDLATTKTTTFWYDAAGVSGTAGTFYDSDPTVKPEPVAPTVSIKPKSGKEVGPADAISVTFGYGYDEENFSASVTVAGTIYRWGTDFTGKTFTKSVKSLGLTSSGSISVSASCSNSAGNASDSASLTYNPDKAEDPFTWDNVNIYFVIPDRFYDGNSSNNTSYGRYATDPTGYNIGTFHGGDIAGLTEKLDYLDALGVNAIWITAPYEQIHGWVGGGSGGEFQHFAYHGYYVLDYTEMDKNMGTVDEFRTFVDAAHSKGIRVVMDIVMNHTGYENMKDMETYGYGSLIAGASFSWSPSGSETWHDKPINKKTGSNWDKFWGADWIRGEFNGYTDGGGDDLTKCLDYLPDFKTESKSAVDAPVLLQTKWAMEASGYDDWIVPAAKDLRKTLSNTAPTEYVEKWLAAWVREFGIDGFRCDTAKHVDMYRWAELKALCESALSEWREDNTRSASSKAKEWDEGFWMTGECFGWKYSNSGDYFTTGHFDSMINFRDSGENSAGSVPTADEWVESAGRNTNSLKDDDGNGNHNSELSYVSSHDTGLCRPSGGNKELGTMLQLMPGGVQIFYGDETARPFGATGTDKHQGTRSDFNWSAANGDCANHWKKVGTFRKWNPAVGAGSQTVSEKSYKRSYSGSAGENKVAISISGTNVDVSSLWSDGTKVYNWYDGTSATVSGGSVSFAGGTTTQPILVSEKNPEDYGLTF